MESWSCDYCDKVLERTGTEDLHEARKDHVVKDHYQELGQDFLESGYSENCQNCSSTLPDEPEGDPLECPHCGHIHDMFWAGVRDASTWDV
jgi:hypothetical protein